MLFIYYHSINIPLVASDTSLSQLTRPPWAWSHLESDKNPPRFYITLYPALPGSTFSTQDAISVTWQCPVYSAWSRSCCGEWCSVSNGSLSARESSTVVRPVPVEGRRLYSEAERLRPKTVKLWRCFITGKYACDHLKKERVERELEEDRQMFSHSIFTDHELSDERFQFLAALLQGHWCFIHSWCELTLTGLWYALTGTAPPFLQNEQLWSLPTLTHSPDSHSPLHRSMSVFGLWYNQQD